MMVCKTGALAALLLSSLAPAMAQDGGVDLNFGVDGRQVFTPDGVDMHEIRFNAAKVFADGSILLAGYRHKKNPQHPAEPNFRVAIAKLTANGMPDAAFGADATHPGLVILDDLSPGSNIQEARAIALLPDGQALIAGSFNAGPMAGFTFKIDAAGSIVDSYGGHGIASMPMLQFEDVALDSHGNIVIAGQGRGGTPAYRSVVVRLDGATGAPDPTFDRDGIFDLVESDENGIVDHAGGLRTLAITADDRIVVGGYQEQNSFVYGYSLARLTAAGELDATFSGGGWQKFVPTWSDSFDAVIARIELTQHGEIIFAGDYTVTGTSHVRPVIAKMSADGVPDAAFGAPASPGFSPLDVRSDYGWQRASGLALQSDGHIVITATANEFDTPPGPAEFVASRVDATGQPDAAFGAAGNAVISTAAPTVFSDATALALQNDRPIIVGNNGFPSAGAPPQLLVRGTVIRLDNEHIFSDGFDD